MRTRPRLTIRVRFALLATAVSVTTGTGLLAIMYLLVRRQLAAADSALVQSFVVQGSGAQLGPFPQASVSPAPAATLTFTPLPPDWKPDTVSALVNDSRHGLLQSLITESALAIVVASLIALALCWLLAHRALRPVRNITEVASRLSHDTLDERINSLGPGDEVKHLADTFDGMLDRLHRSFQAQRMFAANASHELRTPLAIIQTAAETTLSRPHRTELEYRRALTTTLTAAQRSDRLLASLLTLAQAGRRTLTENIDLAAAARAETSRWPPAGPTLHGDLRPAVLAADPVLLDLLLRNLLDNAVRYNVPGGQVWLGTRLDADHAVLTVENTGPVVGTAQIPALRQAFQRGGHRTGAANPDGLGLGLAIVDAIVDAHHGNWSVVARPGGGLAITLNLPCGDVG